MNKLISTLSLTLSALSFVCLASSAFAQTASTDTKKPKKRKAPVAAIISEPKGEVKKPTATKILSSVDDVEKKAEEKVEAPIEQPEKEAVKPKSEVLTAPKGDLPPVKNPEPTEDSKPKEAKAPILRSPEEAKKDSEASSTSSVAAEIIRTVDDVKEE